MKKQITTIILLLLPFFLLAERGTMLVNISLDKKQLSYINTAIMDNIGKHALFVNGKYIYLPFIQKYTPDEAKARVDKYHLDKSVVTSLLINIDWDTNDEEGTIIGIAPVYEKYPDSTFYYVLGNFLFRIDSAIRKEIVTQTTKAIEAKINTPGIYKLPDNVSVREMDCNSYREIAYMPLSSIAQQYFWSIKKSEVRPYKDMSLLNRTNDRYFLEDSTLPNNMAGSIYSYKFQDSINEKHFIKTDSPNKVIIPLPWDMSFMEGLLNPVFKSIYIKETWSDTTVSGLYGADSNLCVIRKRINAIGIKYRIQPTGADKTLWFRYEEYLWLCEYLDHIPDQKRHIAIYNAYLESDFCKKANVDFDF